MSALRLGKESRRKKCREAGGSRGEGEIKPKSKKRKDIEEEREREIKEWKRLGCP